MLIRFKSFVFLIIFLMSLNLWAQHKLVDGRQYLIYVVSKDQWLYSFAKSLGMPSNKIPDFIKTLILENPQIKNPELVYRGDKIFISSELYQSYVQPKSSFVIYKNTMTDPSPRLPASEIQSQIKETLSQQRISGWLIEPSLSFSRIDTKDLSSGGDLKVLSDPNIGFISTYMDQQKQNNFTYYQLKFERHDYPRTIGKNITENQFNLFSMYIGKRWTNHSGLIKTAQLGMKQLPYIFTDSSGDLVSRKVNSPEVSTAISKSWHKDWSSGLSAGYLFGSYAGSVEIKEAYFFEAQVTKSKLQFFYRELILESSLTDQKLAELGLKLQFRF